MWRPSRTGLRAEKMDYVVVAPDDPLCLGLVDLLAAQRHPRLRARQGRGPHRGQQGLCQGPDAAATASPPRAMRPLTTRQAALSYVRTAPCPVVVKADGLALGKGVLICETNAQAEAAVIEMMKNGKFGASGSRVVVEEFLEGPEVSRFVPSPTARPSVPWSPRMDHKRALDGDRGLNTGGMGADRAQPLLHPGGGRALHGGDLPAHAGGHARGRLPLPRAVCTSD